MNPFVYIKDKLEERRARREQEPPVDKAARVTANATGWMALFTFVLMLVGVGTYLILKNQLQEMREEQRAWVGVLDAVSEPQSFTETEPWRVRVVFFNSGRTPARNVQISGMFRASSVPVSGPTPEQAAQLVFRPAQSIAPQGSFRAAIGSEFAAEASTTFQKQGLQTVVSQYKLIKNKELFLYYFGILKYDDGSGKNRETEYCVLLANPDTKESGFCDAFNDLN